MTGPLLAELIHRIGNTMVGLLYLGIFFVVWKNFYRESHSRNFLAVAVGALFCILAAMFFFHAFFLPVKEEFYLELGWIVLNLFLGLSFLALRKRYAVVLGEESQASAFTRFARLKHEFLSVASHELRTPLSVINGFAEILLREKLGPLNDEQKRRVRKILMQGRRLNQIIDELLDLSRIRSGKIEMRKEVFDLIPVLKACLDDHEVVCRQHGILLCDELPDVLPDVVGDLERVTQVLVNLLNNAIKYTDTGGKITVRARYGPANESVRVEVEDTGIGIAEEDRGKIFEEFYRATAHHKKKYEGTGLGLAIVKQLVQSQGGRVGVESAGLGKGALFYFTLPVAKKTHRLPLPIRTSKKIPLHIFTRR